MKQVLILFTFLFGLNLIHAQIFGVEKIKDAGENDKRLNEFGWSHQTLLKLGIKKTYDYFLNELKK